MCAGHRAGARSDIPIPSPYLLPARLVARVKLVGRDNGRDLAGGRVGVGASGGDADVDDAALARVESGGAAQGREARVCCGHGRRAATVCAALVEADGNVLVGALQNGGPAEMRIR